MAAEGGCIFFLAPFPIIWLSHTHTFICGPLQFVQNHCHPYLQFPINQESKVGMFKKLRLFQPVTPLLALLSRNIFIDFLFFASCGYEIKQKQQSIAFLVCVVILPFERKYDPGTSFVIGFSRHEFGCCSFIRW